MRAILLVVLLAMMEVAAAAPAEVRALQAPAWRVHDGTRTALSPGLALDSTDRVITGAGARVVLALSEGSTVKLGEHAELALAELTEPAAAGGVFKGFLDVVRGAFRFTTTVVGRQRDIRARVGTATIGIRGTDVWGKHEDSRDFVVLLEGKISIERDGQTLTMSDAQSLFMAPAGAPALPLAPVNPEDLGRWAQETELQAGAGQRDGQGRFRLMFKAQASANEAQALVAQLAEAGHGAMVEEMKGASRWRAVIAGYASEAEAQAAAAQLATAVPGLRPWISQAP